jgi:hypothetical protein
MRRIAAAAFAAVLSTSAYAEKCSPGAAAHEQADWEFLENNAARTADAYAVDYDQPNALPAFGKIDVVYQVSGEHEGHYLVMIVSETHLGTAFMMLKPQFDFCGDIARLDDESPELFSVVVAKFNGQPF